MKIVQLVPYAMDRPGGVQRHVRDLSAWLTAEGHEVRILCPPPVGDRPPPSATLTRVGGSANLALHGTAFELSWIGARARDRAVAELRDWGAELVHMHTPWTPFMVERMWKALDLPTVATVHATLPAPDRRAPVDIYIRRAARRILSRVESVVVPSAAPVFMLRKLLPGEELQILPPAIDLSAWIAAGEHRRTQSGLSLLFLGRLEPRKGVDVLLRAWPQIAAALPDVQLTVAGDGALRDAVVAAQSDRLTWAGRPDDAAARALMAQADLFLAPAPYGESFGLVLTEAMAAGALPVAAANAGYASVLTGPGEALLVPPGDAGALAARVIELGTDELTRVRLVEWAQREAARFDISAQGPRYAQLFETVLRAERG